MSKTVELKLESSEQVRCAKEERKTVEEDRSSCYKKPFVNNGVKGRRE